MYDRENGIESEKGVRPKEVREVKEMELTSRIWIKTRFHGISSVNNKFY
jgi:hypothetical protein